MGTENNSLLSVLLSGEMSGFLQSVNDANHRIDTESGGLPCTVSMSILPDVASQLFLLGYQHDYYLCSETPPGSEYYGVMAFDFLPVLDALRKGESVDFTLRGIRLSTREDEEQSFETGDIKGRIGLDGVLLDPFDIGFTPNQSYAREFGNTPQEFYARMRDQAKTVDYMHQAACILALIHSTKGVPRIEIEGAGELSEEAKSVLGQGNGFKRAVHVSRKDLGDVGEIGTRYETHYAVLSRQDLEQLAVCAIIGGLSREQVYGTVVGAERFVSPEVDHRYLGKLNGSRDYLGPGPSNVRLTLDRYGPRMNIS